MYVKYQPTRHIEYMTVIVNNWNLIKELYVKHYVNKVVSWKRLTKITY